MSCEVVSASGTCLEPRGVGFPRTLISPQNLPDFGETLKDVDRPGDFMYHILKAFTGDIFSFIAGKNMSQCAIFNTSYESLEIFLEM